MNGAVLRASSAPSGGGGGVDIGSILEASEGIQNSWLDFSQQRLSRNASSPCQAEQELGSYMTGVLASTITRAESASLLLSDSLYRAITRAVEQWGRADGDYIGTHPFGVYLVDGGIVDSGRAQVALAIVAALTGTPWLAGAIDEVVGALVDAHLPPEGTVPQGTRSGDDKGFQVGPGAWLWAGPGRSEVDHVLDGTLRGDAVRQAFYSWRRRIREDVAPADHGNARDDLVALVGRGRPLDAPDWWRVWRPGDAVRGKLGDLHRINGELRGDLEFYRYECQLDRAAARQAQQDAADLARQSKENELWALLALAAVAVAR